MSLLNPYLAGLLVCVVMVLAIRAKWFSFFRPEIYAAALTFPGPKPVSYFKGTLPLMPSETWKTIPWNEQIQKQYGDIFTIFLGPMPVFSCSNPRLAEEVFKSNEHTTKGVFYRVLDRWIGGGLVLSQGERWHTRRRQLTAAFHFDILKEYYPIFQEQALVFRNKLDRMGVAEGQIVDIFHEGTLATLDVINEAAMGTKIDAQSQPESQYVKSVLRMSSIALERQHKPWGLIDWFYYNFTDLGAEEKGHIKFLHYVTDQTIRKRKAALKDVDNAFFDKRRLAFLDLLLKIQRENPNEMTDVDIRKEVDTFMFAGHDTTAASIGWCFYELGRNPDIQQRLQAELDEVLGDKEQPDIEDLKDLVYLNCVVRETLRLHPSVLSIGRILGKDLHLPGGRVVPKGATFRLMLRDMCRHEDDFVEPLKFAPERWLPDPPKKYLAKRPHPMAACFFSAGARNCIGQRFAVLEEKVMIATVMKAFNLKTVGEAEQRAELIVRPGNGINVRLTARTEITA
eukprot:Clim_evm3s107 gene=Clim_evmTU3s107